MALARSQAEGGARRERLRERVQEKGRKRERKGEGEGISLEVSGPQFNLTTFRGTVVKG